MRLVGCGQVLDGKQEMVTNCGFGEGGWEETVTYSYHRQLFAFLKLIIVCQNLVFILS